MSTGRDPKFQSLRDRFLKAHGLDDGDGDPRNDAKIAVIRSPGRVNLIGEHTDYNDGLVFPMAIEPSITFAVRRRNDGQVHVVTEKYPDDAVTFEIDDDEPGEPKWSNYVRGPVAMLRRDGQVMTGMDVYLVNTLPVGAGLSSSAAMEVGTAVSMLHLTGGDMDRQALAKLCQKAEHEFAGVPCGIMDQTVVACGRAGHALMLDCRSGEITHVPLDPAKLAVVITNSKVEHALTGGEYAERRRRCEEAARHFGVPALRDVTAEQVAAADGKLDETTRRRARHVVTEIARVLAFAEALERGDYRAAGQHMYASHDSLRDDYEVSTDELDFLVETAKGLDGVYGARMTGAGFGGCTVTLCDPAHAAAVARGLERAFKEKLGIETEAFISRAADGARVLD